MAVRASFGGSGSGGGVTTLQGESGAVTLTSSGATIAITTPTGSTINLEAAGSAGVTSLNSQTGVVNLINANGVSYTATGGNITTVLGAITPSSVVASGNVSGLNLSGTNTGDQTSVSGNAGTATKLQNARTIAGTSFDGSANISLANKFIVQGTTDSGLSSAQFLGALGTGIVKNTTSTGVLSIATAGTDYAPATISLIGATNVAAVLATAGTSVTFTASEVTVGTALGGTKYTMGSFSQTFNGSGTGIGGMDTGSIPTSGYVALYAAWNGTSQGIFGCSTATSYGPAYTGANAPSGYTQTCLLGIWPTNSSAQLIVGRWIDREFGWGSSFQTALNQGTATSITSVSISSIVPPGTKYFFGVFNCAAAGDMTIAAATDQTFYVKYTPPSGALVYIKQDVVNQAFAYFASAGTTKPSIYIQGYGI